MKTAYLAVRTLPEDFRSDLRTFDVLSDSQVETLLGWLHDLRSASEAPDPEQYRDLANQLSLGGKQLNGVLSTAAFAADAVSRYDDSPTDFVDDLLADGLLAESGAARFLKFMDALKDHPVFARPQTTVLRAAFEVLASVKTRCVALASYRNEYGLEDDPSSYAPDISSIDAGIEFRIATDGPTGEHEYVFVLTRRQAEKLGKRIPLAVRQLDTFQERFK